MILSPIFWFHEDLIEFKNYIKKPKNTMHKHI